MFNCRVLEDFSIPYTVQDFLCLINDNNIDGFIDEDAKFEVAMYLLHDYQEGRANAFGYVDGIHDARLLLEIRKVQC
jgi:hypothetical protein